MQNEDESGGTLAKNDRSGGKGTGSGTLKEGYR
jgi:hypothetical protein